MSIYCEGEERDEHSCEGDSDNNSEGREGGRTRLVKEGRGLGTH